MAALAGLVHAGAIAHLVYPGDHNAPLRARLADLFGQDPALTVPGTSPEPGNLDDPFRHVVQTSVHSAIHHCVHAAALLRSRPPGRRQRYGMPGSTC